MISGWAVLFLCLSANSTAQGVQGLFLATCTHQGASPSPRRADPAQRAAADWDFLWCIQTRIEYYPLLIKWESLSAEHFPSHSGSIVTGMFPHCSRAEGP